VLTAIDSTQRCPKRLCGVGDHTCGTTLGQPPTPTFENNVADREFIHQVAAVQVHGKTAIVALVVKMHGDVRQG